MNPKKFLKNLPKLSEDAQKEWDRIIKALGDDNVNELDLSLLYDYAKTFADVLRLEEEVESEGEILVSTQTGSPYTNPRFHILSNRRETLCKLRRDLNMTPKARAEKSGKNVGSLEDLIR